MACVALPAMGAQIDCGKMLAETAAKNFGKPVIADAQGRLAKLGYNPGGADGLLGVKTKASLTQFCLGAQFALNKDLLEMLRAHGAIYAAHRDWKQTLASKGFQKWAEKQADAKEIGQTRQAGNS
ncbi:MAG TPA: peptidoglycan-binding domain-containing protein, partial [Gallionella sp.]|nr:peptidoglycan-binding domain-containing protein [Gallionella sp.]